MTLRFGAWLALAGIGAFAIFTSRAPKWGPLVTTTTESSNPVRAGIELVPAIRPPTTLEGRVRISTYVELPNDASIRTVGDDGAESLELPAGTLASRVESLADAPGDGPPNPSWQVLDVRSTRFDVEGRRFSVVRPGDHDLAGISWPASAEGARQARAVLPEIFGRDAERLTKLNDCASCHTAIRAENLAISSLVQKGTDASGNFGLLATLSDDGPFETYRPRNPNEDDPFVSARCGSLRVPWSIRNCEDGTRPKGHLDIAGALAAHDPHALRVCASRRAVAAHLDARGLHVFRAALDRCEGR